jgi:hypothetical protein
VSAETEGPFQLKVGDTRKKYRAYWKAYDTFCHPLEGKVGATSEFRSAMVTPRGVLEFIKFLHSQKASARTLEGHINALQWKIRRYPRPTLQPEPDLRQYVEIMSLREDAKLGEQKKRKLEFHDRQAGIDRQFTEEEWKKMNSYLFSLCTPLNIPKGGSLLKGFQLRADWIWLNSATARSQDARNRKWSEMFIKPLGPAATQPDVGHAIVTATIVRDAKHNSVSFRNPRNQVCL